MEYRDDQGEDILLSPVRDRAAEFIQDSSLSHCCSLLGLDDISARCQRTLDPGDLFHAGATEKCTASLDVIPPLAYN
jgi:hypothetical protein